MAATFSAVALPHSHLALLPSLEPSSALALLAAVAATGTVRRLLPDRALARFAGQRWSVWLEQSRVFWGELEPRGGGYVLAFERAYALPGEPVRRALVVASDEAARAIALVRPHADGRPFDELVRADVLARRTRGSAPRDVWQQVIDGARATLDGLDRVTHQLVARGAPAPLQDGWLLERWRGEHVVVETGHGARLAGLLVEIGRSHLALVCRGGANGDGAPRTLRVDRVNTVDGPLELTLDGDALRLAARSAPVHVEHLADSTRSLALGVTLLPGTTLHMPWPGAKDSAHVVATARCGFGFDVIVPRATARVVFAGDDQTHTRAAGDDDAAAPTDR
jgi:hypothetical protein